MPDDRKGLIRMAPRMAPNTRIRLIPLLLLCMSGASYAQGLPALKVSPDLLRTPRPSAVEREQAGGAQTAGQGQPAPAAGARSVPSSPAVVEERALPARSATAPATPPAAATPATPATPAVSKPEQPAAKPEPGNGERKGDAALGASPEAAVAPAAAPAPAALAPGMTAVSALRLSGSRGVELIAEGEAELQRDDTVLTADKVTYREPTDEALAEGNVVLSRGTDTIRGPRATLVVGDRTGQFESPRYELSRARSPGLAGEAPRAVSGSGEADVLRLEGENQYRLKNATWTTCSPTDPDWYIKARELELDYDREVGTAHGSSIVFMDTPLFWMPWIEFPLNGQRQSGLLPPTFGSSNKTGVDFTQPYYWNIAPNYDATVAPRFMSRRGVQIGGEFRYLGADYQGTTRVEWMPEDRVTGEERRLGSIQHQHRFAPNLYGTLDLNAVSDDTYFEDLSSNVGVASRVNLLRQGRLNYTGGWWTASARVQSYQTLSPDPEKPNYGPYRRVPQVLLSALRPDLAGGFSAGMDAEYVQFEHKLATRVEGGRLTAYPHLSLPMQGAAWFVTPKVGVHYSQYSLERPDIPSQKDLATSINRSVPIMSIDSGLFFDRETEVFGRGYAQTLEPRFFYLKVPYRDQSAIPLFDTSRYDVGFAQIFAENRYSGKDRIGDANDLTAAVTTRFIESDTGVERLRALIGQRYYFSDQRVGLSKAETLRASGRGAELLAGLGGRLSPSVSMDSYLQYNTETSQSERINANVRYQPEFGKVLNLSYRYAPKLVIDLEGQDVVGLKDIDVSGQWPITRNWYGVGRVTHSIKDGRVTEAIAGLEYNGGCWVFRTAVHRFAIDENDVTNSIFVQLELNDLAGIGSNPLSLIKRSVPGYGKINDSSADRVFGAE
ncbi:LPS-assembly protein LptD [Thauera sp. JM12B12]|uniref:LPS-assembly protein LptD n=1 Tax=Thauera sp. JM12B12 TaxID=3142262 RepID=UPI0031F427DA